MTDSLRLRVYYGMARVVAWVAHRLVGLRRDVIRGNLARSFSALPVARLEAGRAAIG